MKDVVSEKNPFSTKTSMSVLRVLFQIGSLLAPGLTAQIALQMFLTPPKQNKLSNKEKALDAESKSTVYPFSNKHISSYAWGDGNKTVLLVHGWGGRGTHMGGFVKPLVEAGYRVIAFDGPAHGHSGGKQTDMIEFATAIHWMTETVGPVCAIVAHSFGAGCTLLAHREFGLQVGKLVLISCFSDSIYITESFGKLFGIKSSTIARMRRILEDRHNNNWTWEGLAGSDMVRHLSIPTFLIHDENDEEVPYAQALELEAAGKSCSLFTTKGLGHRLILRHPSVIKKGVSFCNCSQQEAELVEK